MSCNEDDWNLLPTKLQFPIIQGPFGGLSSQRLTAAVSNFGGLGSFGAHSLLPDAIKDVIAEIRSLTSKPFAMNLWVSMEDEGARTADENAFNRSLDAETMIHFTEAVGLSRYTLYMQDYGGPVDFRMVVAHPERVEALIVQDAVAHNEGLGANWKTRRAFWADRAPTKGRCPRISCR